ncbi:MAG: hypothetical protein ACFFE8_04140 [Candidatus Heimdallarchaeota archaeon]
MDPIAREIRELHDFFVKWYNGQIPRSKVGFSRLEEAIADDFVLLSPNGQINSRKQVIDHIYSAYGSHKKDTTPFQIRIENITIQPISSSFFIAMYEEWHDSNRIHPGRISTALFHINPNLANGVEWIHLHETWIPDTE